MFNLFYHAQYKVFTVHPECTHVTLLQIDTLRRQAKRTEM